MVRIRVGVRIGTCHWHWQWGEELAGLACTGATGGSLRASESEREGWLQGLALPLVHALQMGIGGGGGDRGKGAQGAGVGLVPGVPSLMDAGVAHLPTSAPCTANTAHSTRT